MKEIIYFDYDTVRTVVRFIHFPPVGGPHIGG